MRAGLLRSLVVRRNLEKHSLSNENIFWWYWKKHVFRMSEIVARFSGCCARAFDGLESAVILLHA